MSNTALFLEDIKQEVESLDYREGTPSRPHSAYRRRSPDSQTITDFRSGADLSHRAGSHSLKACKIEEDVQDAGESTFSLFASLLDSANEGAYVNPAEVLYFLLYRLCISWFIICRLQGFYQFLILFSSLRNLAVMFPNL